MSSIHVPKFDAGQRIVHDGRHGTVLHPGKYEQTIVFRFDGDDENEWWTHERWLSPESTP